MLGIIKRISLVLIFVVVVVIAFNWYAYFLLKGEKTVFLFNSFDNTQFSGTLLSPRSKGPHPAILLLHGSGKASGLPPFVTAHANAFLKQGIAVVVYDKRGSGESAGDFDTATYQDFIEDALAALNAMRQMPTIDPSNIGVMGSSESGWFTPEIAARDGQVKFIINRAGPPLSWIDTNLWEIKHELLFAGLNEGQEMNEFLSLRKDIWHYYRDSSLAKEPLKVQREYLSKRLETIDARWLDATGMRLAAYEQEKFERWTQDIFYSPRPFLEQLSVPLYAVFAGSDQNVPTKRSVEVLQELKVSQKKQIQFSLYEGYLHGMAKWYNVLWMGYPPSYLQNIGEWASEQFRQ